MMEIERTFLARHIPEEISRVQPFDMVDVYLPQDVPHPRIRVRKKGDQHEITKKVPLDPNNFSVQREQTIPLDRDEFNALCTVSNLVVTKKRYVIDVAGRQAEVDVFGGGLAGLVLIDFEFENEAEKDAFVPPDFCLADVTQELFLAGGMLAGKDYADIAESLKKFSYTALSYSHK